MSIPLLKREIKSNYKILLLFMGIVTLYSGIITAMYDPEVGTGINAMAESMPEFLLHLVWKIRELHCWIF